MNLSDLNIFFNDSLLCNYKLKKIFVAKHYRVL